MRPMNEREIFTSDATVVQVDEQDPQQMQVRKRFYMFYDRIVQTAIDISIYLHC